MSEKKNIDRLFQEQFKDFEAAPPEYVWENIYEALQEKKKRRVIPLWLRLGGVAAILLIGFAISWPFFSGIDTGKNPVVIEQQAKPALHEDSMAKPGQLRPTGPGVDNDITPPGQGRDGIVNAGKVNGAGNDNSGRDGINGAGKNKTGDARINTGTLNNHGEDAVAGTDSRNGKANKNAGKSIRNKQHGSSVYNTASDAVAGTSGATKKARNGKSSNSANKAGRDNYNNVVTGNAQDALAAANRANKTNRNGNGADKNGAAQNQGAPTDVIQDKKTVLAQNSATDKNKTGQEATPDTTKDGVNKDMPVIENTLPVEQAVAEVITDTTKVQPENALEKLLREQQQGTKDEEQVAEADGPKWNIKPQVAPVFYNSLSQGSPIDEQFSANAKSFNNDLSVGVGIDYAVTSRLSIRSGINSVNLNYATQNVEFYASLTGSTNNVSPSARNANIVVQDKTEGQSTVGFASSSKDAYSGSMVQRTGYLEVPVEMSYALLNKRFGIEVIGGVSTLFLNQNNVSVVSTQGLSTSVGEAENLNNIHFSTNVGVGFKYRFLKSFEASFEPMFKYQVNTFSRDAGNFKPYFIGLYSGISFSF